MISWGCFIIFIIFDFEFSGSWIGEYSLVSEYISIRFRVWILRVLEKEWRFGEIVLYVLLFL